MISPTYPKVKISTQLQARLGEILLSLVWFCSVFARILGLRNLYRVLLIHLVKRTGLFDSSTYLKQNNDVAQNNIPPLFHYVAYGDREGRWPMPLFDPSYYRSRVHGRTKNINSLLHYAYVGRHRFAPPSAWFDLRYYLTNNKDVARSKRDPLIHYIKCGGIEGRSPNPQFDGAFYLQQYPDVRDAGLNPLLHYIEHGQQEGRVTRSMEEEFQHKPKNPKQFVIPKEPEQEDWRKLENNIVMNCSDEPVLDVVIPVYRNRSLTWLCLSSVLTTYNKIPFQLIVINDASPEKELRADLIEMASRGWLTLIENKKNLGFVKTANIGFSLHSNRDVVLLNSDTEVYSGWLDRLHRAAHYREKIASVTPLSNNATICSYPRFLHDNPYPLETDYHLLDQLTSKVNENVAVETPTGVGFCMYFRRSAIDQIGLFDATLFDKGYGEENDWCQRAISKGFVNLITADTFVRHFGSASFLGETAKRTSDAMKILGKRHRTYRKQIQKFVQSDPLFYARQQLDWARLQQHVKPQNTLFVCHNRNGGAERHLQEDASRLREMGQGVFFMRPARGQKTHIRIQHPSCRQLLNLPHFRLADTQALSTVLTGLGITCIHSHGLVDFEPQAAMHLHRLCQEINAELQIDIHDYKVICPRINLIDPNGMYCSEPDTARCNHCLTVNGNDFGVKDITKWREMHNRVLLSARKVWVPDEDVANRLKIYFPDAIFHVAAHENAVEFIPKKNLQLPLKADEKLRVVVIGAIGKIKGYDILLACANEALQLQLPIEFVVMGYTMNDTALEKAGVTITGKYNDQSAPDLLAELDPHLVWLPSTWPETYSYTLSIALQQGCLLSVFDMGAMARRLRAIGGKHLILPLELARQPKALLTSFLNHTQNIGKHHDNKYPEYELVQLP